MTPVEIRHFQVYCGLGGGARGFNHGRARLDRLEAHFRCLGGIDNDPAAIADFKTLAGINGTVLDLFSREQYTDYHGHLPPADWREATPDDLRRAANYERPHVVFMSAPCQGYSGLLNETKSRSPKYQALNQLALRGLWLTLEAWTDDPPEFILFENVPRIQNRGRAILDQVIGLLQAYGYAVAETVHDCGELGGLAQHRKRCLLVARHPEKVPPFLYEPPRQRIRGVGELLARMAAPTPDTTGLHRLPNLTWKNWVRLALIPPGRDWRSLHGLRVHNGLLEDYIIAPTTNWHDEILGVLRWSSPCGTVTGHAGTTTGKFSIADPRCPTSHMGKGKYRVVPWDLPAGTVISASTTGNGAFAVADPRPGWSKTRAAYQTAGHYGVIPWDAAAGSVVGKAKHDTGRWSVADPRLPADTIQGTWVIQALDGSWHRPFTTLELAVLQGLLEPEDYLELHGRSTEQHRKRIGNAVPSPTAAAIAGEMGKALLAAWSGAARDLSGAPVWVRQLHAAVNFGSTLEVPCPQS